MNQEARRRNLARRKLVLVVSCHREGYQLQVFERAGRRSRGGFDRWMFADPQALMAELRSVLKMEPKS